MVLIHLKNSDQEQFLYETTVSAQVKEVTRELAEVYNLRHRITRLKLEGGELASYGPAKHPDKQGIDSYATEATDKGPHYNMDPTGRRSGNACDAASREVLLKTLKEVDEISYKNQSERKPLTVNLLTQAIDAIRGAVMIAYPMGLPEWDFVRQCLEARDDLTGTSFGGEDIDPETGTLWFAGKLMQPNMLLSNYVGRNDRTKVVLKLQKRGAGAPSREPVVDADTQKAMLAWYYKKQEEEKRLAEDEDDSYTSSTWANPKTLKAHFSGVMNTVCPCAADMTGGRVIELNSEEEWQQKLKETAGFGGKALVVDFSAVWCGPCQMIGPVFEKLSTQHTDVTFVKVDVDKLQGVASACGVRAMPTFQGYVNGAMVAEEVGADPRKLEALIRTVASKVTTGQGRKLGSCDASGSTAPSPAPSSADDMRARMAAAAEARMKAMQGSG